MCRSRGHILAVAVVLLSFLSLSLPLHAQDECEAIGWIDETFPLTDYCKHTVDLAEISAGCRFRECIPALSTIQTESIDEASTWLAPQSPVITVAINGEAHAYPQAILVYHEIANDEVGGVPVTVTYCPLCNSSIVFQREVDGEVKEFAVTGLLRNSDLIMFDRETETWWQQFTGEAIVGVHAGELLDIIPSHVIGFGQFAEQYPDGLVMSRNTDRPAPYGEIPSHYANYTAPFLYQGDIDSRLPATSHVLAGEVGDVPMAYPFDILADEFVINDTVGGEAVVALWQPGTAAMMDKVVVDDSLDIGSAALYRREVDGQVLTFAYDAETGTITDNETGSTWNIFGEATEGELAGTKLQQLVAAPHFWFAWAAFHPETEVYGVE